MNDGQIENIRKSANIVDIISSYIPLTQKGKNYFGVCPFHEDHSPSMSVSVSKQIYKCFSCGAAGNVFTFVKDYENVSFIEAVKIVAEKCGLTFKGTIKSTTRKQNFSTEYEIMNLALKFYQNNLNSSLGVTAKKYLEERIIDEKAIKDFDIGLSLDQNHALNTLLLNKKYAKKTLLELGLVNEYENNIKDIFYHRIMFPIHDLDGNVVGFTGRIYENVENQAKYVNSKESVIFKKGNILFNYHRAKAEIKRKKEVILVEGNMDAIRMYASGIKNVVALMGTSLTDEQVIILKNLRTKIILMFDNDNAGEIATYQNGKILEKNGLEPFVIRLSGEKDPDEYIIKNGIEAMLDNVSKPLSFLDFKLSYIKRDKDLTKTDDLVEYIKELVGEIKNIPDELTREVIIKKTSENYNIPLDLLKNELKKLEPVAKKVVEYPKKLAKKTISKYDRAANQIIYFMINDVKYIIRYQKEIGFFKVRKYRDIANEITYYYETHKTIDMASFISYASPREINDDLTEIIKNNYLEELSMDTFLEYVEALKKEETEEEIKKIKEEMKTELDASKKETLANKILELKKGCV